MPETPQQRFLKLDQVAEELSITTNQVYALVRRGDLEAVKIGGRGQWRVERSKLEEYIEHMYEETRAFIQAHPLQEDVTPELGMDDTLELSASSDASVPTAQPTEQPDATRPVASSPDLSLDQVTAPQRPTASFAERARLHVDDQTSHNRPTDPGVAPPEPTIRRPGL